MKKIGKEVLFLKTSETNPRNGESSMIRLRDGRIMLAFTEYCGEECADHGTARISAACSTDEGESWGKPFLLMDKPAGAQNIMSPSLFRLSDGGLGMVYLRKDVRDDFGVTCLPMFVRSDDEGESFSEPVSCGFPDGYYCSVNDSVLVASSGRIYIPTSYTGECRDVMKRMESPAPTCVSDIRTAYSDDNGKSWKLLDTVLKSPYSNRRGLFEPGILELDCGELWMYFRTCFGHQYDSVSSDNGESWSAVEPNFRFTSPDSPMRVKKINEFAVAVFNPCGYNCLNSATETNKSPKRTPIVMAVSKDGGQSFTDRNAVAAGGGLIEFAKNTYILEDDTSESYCYPSILAVKDGILISYYHSDGDVRCLNASKVIKVYYDEIG